MSYFDRQLKQKTSVSSAILDVIHLLLLLQRQFQFT